MEHFFIDTNIVIDFTKKIKSPLDALVANDSLFINHIVVTELLSGTEIKNVHSETAALDILKLFTVLPITTETATIAAEIVRKGYIPFIADAYIAASCLEHNLSLITNNKKHFRHVPKLKLI